MKSHRLWRSLSYVVGVVLLVAAPGCDEEFAAWSSTSQSRFERTLTRQIVLGSTDTLDVATRFGSISITGTDAADCNLEARIVAQAPTEQEAQELAEQVEILGEAASGTLKIRCHEPTLAGNRSISVSYTISIPRRMNVHCDSSYGSLDVSDIEGRLDGKSGNGSIKTRDIQGAVDLNTSYGSIECRNVVGQSISLHSNNGSITMAGLRGSTAVETSYGAIACEDFSDGDLRLKSGNGRIEISDASFGVCDAQSSYGAVAANNLQGDSIELRSGNGSVEIADAQAKTLDVSSSYGRIAAAGIAAEYLTAESGNGSVNVVCTAATPAGLNARVKSSYGSVEFTAPPEFSGEVYLSTSYGSIHTARPVSTSGEITKKRIAGRIGDGTGKIHLESSSGSVELK
jgi:DUF4097 and DUF4098 domain-containing protein YvlB